MTDLIVITGDKVIFLPQFGAALVVPKPGKMKGSGPGTVRGKKICVIGDEKKVEVQGCQYLTPQYCIPGSGTLKIDTLASNQKAKKSRTGGQTVLLRGMTFKAKFEVQSPAKQPPPAAGPPIPDPTKHYMGQGMFVTNNKLAKGS